MKATISIVLSYALAGLLCSGAGSKVSNLIKEAETADEPRLTVIIQQLLKINPKCGDAFSLRGLLKYSKADYQGAVQDFSKAISLKITTDQMLLHAYNYRYHAYIKLKDWEHALDTCVQCLEVQHSPLVAHDAALLCSKLGRSADVSKYLLLERKYHAEFRALPQKIVEKYFAPDKLDKTLAAANRSIHENPSDVHALLMRACCYEKKHEYDKELNDLNTVVKLEPNSPISYIARAGAYKLLGKTDLAIADLRKAHTLHSYAKNSLRGKPD